MEFVDRHAFRSPALVALIEWYDRLVTEFGGWPPRRAFRAETIAPAVLPHAGRVDVTPEPFRVFYRAVGTVISESIGAEVSGKALDELNIPQAADVAEWYRLALAAPAAIFVRGEQEIDGPRFVYEGCCLPFGTPADSPRAFVIGEDYLNTAAWRSAVRQRRYDRPR